MNPALADDKTPAGSIVKIITARVAVLNHCKNLMRPRECRGALRAVAPNGRPQLIRCWNPRGHGSLQLSQAIAQSCNLFFFSLGRELNPATFQAEATAAGFSAATPQIWHHPLRYYGDVAGLCLTPRNAARWMLQLAHSQDPPSSCATGQQQLRAGMLAAVHSGTAKAARVPGLQIAGKTGTAMYTDGSNRTWGWFVGWARPLKSARVPIALALRLPLGTGPTSAAELAGKILRGWKARGCP